jgi:phage recombination protein Bet
MNANPVFDAVISGAGSLELSIESQTDEAIVFDGPFGHATVYADGRVESQVPPYADGLKAIILGQEPPVKAKNGTKNGNKAIMPTNGQKASLANITGSTLTLEKVRDFFCKTATEEECRFALEVCAIRGLNPFKLDCYFVKFDGKDAKLEIMVSKNFFLKRAEAHPDFEYLKAGVIVQKGETVEEAERSFPYPGETLLGGWCIVKRKSNAVPYKMAIDLKTFKKENKFWNQSPGAGYMIRKTAVSLDLKEAFPNDLGGLYDVDELGIDPEKEVASR